MPMPKKRPQPHDAASLVDELRSIDAGGPARNQAGATSLCLVRVVRELAPQDWDELVLNNGLSHWSAVRLPGTDLKADHLTQAIARLFGEGAPAHGPGLLRHSLAAEIDRARHCRQPLALALIQPDVSPLADSQFEAEVLEEILDLVQGLKRSFDVAARLDEDRLALVLSGTPLAIAERMVGSMLRRIRSAAFTAATDVDSGLACSSGLVGYGGCVELCAEDLIARAEAALAEARRRGGNRLEVAPPIDAELASRETLVHANEKHFLFTGKICGKRTSDK